MLEHVLVPEQLTGGSADPQLAAALQDDMGNQAGISRAPAPIEVVAQEVELSIKVKSIIAKAG